MRPDPCQDELSRKETACRTRRSRYLTFEYIGPDDFFGEAANGVRVRGAHCASVDAAFLLRTVDDVAELVLVEWKYTEPYRLRPSEPAKDRVLAGRYAAAIADPQGPVRGGHPARRVAVR